MTLCRKIPRHLIVALVFGQSCSNNPPSASTPQMPASKPPGAADQSKATVGNTPTPDPSDPSQKPESKKPDSPSVNETPGGPGSTPGNPSGPSKMANVPSYKILEPVVKEYCAYAGCHGMPNGVGATPYPNEKAWKDDCAPILNRVSLARSDPKYMPPGGVLDPMDLANIKAYCSAATGVSLPSPAVGGR